MSFDEILTGTHEADEEHEVNKDETLNLECLLHVFHFLHVFMSKIFLLSEANKPFPP
jgi:hypothetical protein